jgi:hypothetical protein
MDCGDAGHILVSGAVADMLRGFGAWRDALRDLGEGTVKHSERLRLFNLCLERVGNPTRRVRSTFVAVGRNSGSRSALMRRNCSQPAGVLAGRQR